MDYLKTSPQTETSHMLFYDLGTTTCQGTTKTIKIKQTTFFGIDSVVFNQTR